MIQAAFDSLAERYDAMWSETPIGRNQRAAVWRSVDPLFQEGDRILDIGCGTGVDAHHFMERGVAVRGIDASAEMVRIACTRGVAAQQLPVESLQELPGRFDGALSNFGALNCVENLEPVARTLGRLIRPRGHLALCVAGRCCAWEALYYLRRGRPVKAFRRWNPTGSRASLGVRVYYPSIRSLYRLFRPEFRLVRWCGIGLCVPPSFVSGASERTVERLAAVDRRLAHLLLLRMLADHRLLVFERL